MTILANDRAIFPMHLIDAAYEGLIAPRPKPTYPFHTRRLYVPPPNRFQIGDYVQMNDVKGQIVAPSHVNLCYWLVQESSGQRALMRYDTLVLVSRPSAIVAVGPVIDHPAPEPPMMASNIIQFPRCAICGRVSDQVWIERDGRTVTCYECHETDEIEVTEDGETIVQMRMLI